MTQSEDLFRAAARYFDLGTEDLSRDDIPFYLDYASKMEGDILELACGTGRIAIPLAEAGHAVNQAESLLATRRQAVASLCTASSS